MPSISLSTGSVYYAEYGQGTPLVLLHANPGDSRDFEAIIPELSKHYRVLALDWPGYGQSAMPRDPAAANVLLFYQVLREFIAALELPPAIFIGNSIGGNAAARLAAESPERVRALVLVAPGGFTPHNVMTRLFCRLQGSAFSLSPYRFARFYLKHNTPATSAMLERAASEQSTPERLALNRAMWRSFSAPENDVRRLAATISAPTLLLFGQHDPAISAKRDGRVAARCIPSAELAVLPSGHAPFAEIPERFLETLQAFFANSAR